VICANYAFTPQKLRQSKDDHVVNQLLVCDSHSNNISISISRGERFSSVAANYERVSNSSQATAERSPPTVHPSQGAACRSVIVTWMNRARQAPSPPLSISLRPLAFANGTSKDASMCCTRLRRPGLAVGLGHQCAKLARMKVHIRLRGQLNCRGPA
jgi:hypothetical protein